MATDLRSRKKLFRIALAVAGKTQGDVAREFGVTDSHLSQVVRGLRVSPPLEQKIEAFIAKYSPAKVA